MFKWLFLLIRRKEVSLLQKDLYQGNQRINQLTKDRIKSEAKLTQLREELDEAKKKTDEIVRKTKIEIDRAEGLNKRLELALDGSQEALRIAEDTIIPALTAANLTFQKTWDCQSAQLEFYKVVKGQGQE